jgi:hypothetical protein
MNLIIALVATWRISHAITQEQVFAWLRDWIKKHVTFLTQKTANGFGDVLQEVTITKKNLWSWLNDLINCPWCTSVWAGAGVIALWYYEGNWFKYVCYALTAAAGSGLLSELKQKYLDA